MLWAFQIGIGDWSVPFKFYESSIIPSNVGFLMGFGPLKLDLRVVCAFQIWNLQVVVLYLQILNF